MSSATNFAGAALTAGLLSALDYGGWAIAYTAFVVILALVRTFAGELQLTLLPSAEASRRRLLSSGAATGAAIGGLVAGVSIAVGATAVGGATRSALFTLAPLLPVLMVQDSIRHSLLALGRARAAAANDGVWLFFSVGGLMVLRRTDSGSVTLAMLAWAGAALPAAGVGLRQAQIRMTRRALVEWFGHARPLAARMLAAHVCSLLASVQMVIAVVGLTKGAQDAGAVRAAQTLLGPIGMVLAATSLHVRPQMARQLRAGDDPFAGAVRVSLFNLAVVLIWTAGAWITPGRYGVRVFGESWESAHALIPAMATVVTVMALASGAVNAILATQRLRSLVWANICMAIACPAVTLAISLMWSTRATVLLYGLATASGAAMLWVALTRTRSR